MSALSFTPVLLTNAASVLTASEKDMRKSGEIARKSGVIAPQTFGRSVAQFLREVFPEKTAACVAAETGIPAATVAKWLEGASAPGGPAYHRLIKSFPDLPAFVSPDTAPAVLREVARQERQDRLERRTAALLREIDGLREGRAR